MCHVFLLKISQYIKNRMEYLFLSISMLFLKGRPSAGECIMQGNLARSILAQDKVSGYCF